MSKSKSFIFIFVILLMNLFSIIADETGDIILDTKSKDRRDNPIMKFRGSLLLGAYYYFGAPLGITTNKNVCDVQYKVYDYTNEADPAGKHHTDGVGYRFGSVWGGLEGGLFVDYSCIAPFLPVDHFLFRGNNIRFTLSSNITPVSMNTGMSVTITPIAFLKFQSGFLIGSGWNFFGLFNGLGRNDGSCTRGRVEPFYGAVFQLWFSGTFQFDIAAVMPAKYKRWTHIVMQATPNLKYEGLLNVSDTTAYQYEQDMAENLNGWYLKGQFLLGYQIPIVDDDTGENNMFIKKKHNRILLTAAMMFIIDKLHLTHYNDSTMASGGWGSDFCYVLFGPVIMADLPNNMNVSFGLQWANDKAWTSETVGNRFYQNRVYDDWYVYFCRILLAVGWNF